MTNLPRTLDPPLMLILIAIRITWNVLTKYECTDTCRPQPGDTFTEMFGRSQGSKIFKKRPSKATHVEGVSAQVALTIDAQRFGFATTTSTFQI